MSLLKNTFLYAASLVGVKAMRSYCCRAFLVTCKKALLRSDRITVILVRMSGFFFGAYCFNSSAVRITVVGAGINSPGDFLLQPKGKKIF